MLGRKKGNFTQNKPKPLSEFNETVVTAYLDP